MTSIKIKILAASIVVAAVLATLAAIDTMRTPSAAAHNTAVGAPRWHGNVACGAMSAADCKRLEMMLPISD